MFPKRATDQIDVKGTALWRQDNASLLGSIEANGESKLFKRESTRSGKPLAKKWDHYLSEEATKRKPSSIKSSARAASQPGMISLGAGAPSSACFPFEEIQVRISNTIDFSEIMKENTTMISMAKFDFEPGVSDYSLDVALNYGQGSGSAQMLRFVTEHTQLIHDPPYSDWACCLTVGSTSAWDSALRIFCEKGDYIILEDYIFSSALETALPLGVKALSIHMDDQGLIPEHLDNVLSSWDEKERKARKPFLLYMVPTGQNPTGATQSLERRKMIYALAQKHSLYIVEDEPYYYIQLPPFGSSDSFSNSKVRNELIPSYLSLDVDGRVLRLDSLSKVLAPGSRMGWVTASEQVIEKFVRLNESSSQHPSGFSQVIVFKLLNHHWGHSGFFGWLEKVQAEYTSRRDTFVQACLEHLPADITSWIPSEAGMFQWIEIQWRSHPLYKSEADHQTVEQAIFASVVEHKVFLTPGSCFWSNADVGEERMFFRATYASASREELKEAVRRFGRALKAQFA